MAGPAGTDFDARRHVLKMGMALPLLTTGMTALAAGQHKGADKLRENNKAIALAYVRATDRGDIAAMDAVIAPDATWWIVGRRDYDRETIMAINKGRYKTGDFRTSSILGMVAEQERVAIEYETATTEGGVRSYRVFHHLFVIRDGMIRSAREYLDPPPLARPFAVSQAHPLSGPLWTPRTTVSPAVEAETRAVATAFLTGSNPLAKELRAPNFRWWVTSFGYHDLDDYLTKLIALMSSGPREAPIGPTRRDMTFTVEGERAAVHLIKETIFPDYDYANRFHMAVIVQGGKVVELREHNDLGAAVRGGLPVFDAMKT